MTQSDDEAQAVASRQAAQGAGPAHTVSARNRAVSLGVSSLFLVVAALLAADLHSSLSSASAQWESNPFISAVAEHIGSHAALVVFKVADFGCLAILYAFWKRSKSHVPTTIVLGVAAIEYFQIVVDNYQG